MRVWWRVDCDHRDHFVKTSSPGAPGIFPSLEAIAENRSNFRLVQISKNLNTTGKWRKIARVKLQTSSPVHNGYQEKNKKRKDGFCFHCKKSMRASFHFSLTIWSACCKHEKNFLAVLVASEIWNTYYCLSRAQYEALGWSVEWIGGPPSLPNKK